MRFKYDKLTNNLSQSSDKVDLEIYRQWVFCSRMLIKEEISRYYHFIKLGDQEALKVYPDYV